jgi:uncharacterized protein DUF3800
MPDPDVDETARVALDESGNTGEALLDPEQPIYVLASTRLTEQEALEVIDSVGWSPDRELKYSKLRRSREGRRVAYEVVAALDPSTARAGVVLKPYMVMAKLVDDLIEPMYARDGHNLYERGLHVALTEVWHHAMPAFCGEDAYRRLLELFVTMSRSPSAGSVHEFYGHVTRLADVQSYERMRDDLLLIAATLPTYLESLSPEMLRGGLDPAVPLLFATASEWGEVLGEPFVIEQDEAKVIEQWRPHLEKAFYSSRPRTVIGAGKRSFSVPLLATSIDLVDSTTSHAVQVADVLAGSVREWVSIKSSGDPARDDEPLLQLDLMPLVLEASVWPTGVVEADETAVLQSNPADQMASFRRSSDR